MCRGVMFGAVGCGAVVPPPKSTIKFVSKPRSMQPPHTPKAPLRKSPAPPPPGTLNSEAQQVRMPRGVCGCGLCTFFTFTFASLSLIF